MPGTAELRRHQQVMRVARLMGIALLVGALVVMLLRRTGALEPYSPLGGTGIVLASLALLGLASGRPGGGRIAAAGGGVVALLIILAAVSPDTLPAGWRLSWPAATVVIAASISLLASTYSPKQAQLVALGVGGFVVAAVGAVSLFIRLSTQLNDLATRSFGGVTLLLAVGALVLGLSMLALGWTDVATMVAVPRWAPAAAATGGIIASLLLWRTLALREEFAIGERTAQAASARARAIERQVQATGRVLLQFASYYDRSDRVPPAAIAALRRDVPAGSVLALIDSSGMPLEVSPSGADPEAIIATVPRRAIRHPEGQPPVAVLEIPGDTANLVLHAALCTAGACPGGVAAVLAFRSINQLIAAGRSVEWLYEVGPSGADPSTNGFRRSVPLHLGELQWTLTARPTPGSINGARSGLPEVVLLLGMISTASLVVAIRFGAAAWSSARAVERMRIAAAITRATDTIWEWDVPLGSLRRSGELWRHLGYDPDRLAQTLAEWLDLVHPDDRDAVQDEFRQVANGHREEFDTEYRVRTSTGSWHTMVDRGRVIDQGDDRQPRRVVGITADVTASRLAERELRETEALTGIGRIAARVAHEINNPLAGIRNAFMLVKDAIPETHPHYRYVGAIEREVDRIATVTRNLYETYRPDDRDRGASLGTIASDAAALLGQVNKRSNVEIAIALDGVPSVVPLSGALLRQIVYNLVQNAVDASPAGGVVDVVGRVEGEALVIEVRDQGPGVPAELRRRIFEPFFTTKPAAVHTTGLGLGLSMVERSVAAAGGAIAVTDTPGGGATFTVRLPLSPQGATV